MTTKPDGGPAMPCAAASIDGTTHLQEGMSLRDYMAAAALTGALARYGFGDIENYSLDLCVKACAENAYAIADAMLAERKK